ncbi:MAG TPA: gamma-glutamyltransferase [Thermoanaerobaculia bacterium]|nr:gamma-glutamyltransferase [Thermoanaerobaculia bacterium]
MTIAFLLFASPLLAGSTITASNAALSTASPYATGAGLAVLKGGGNAIDAAVVVAFALAVVHPQAGNIGGGGFLLYYDAATEGVWALDFREVAPAAAKQDMYLASDGTISSTSRTGPLSAGVPGTVAGLAAAHARFGTKPWKELLAPAIAMAREGIRVDAEMQRELGEEDEERKISQFPSTAALFFPGGKPIAAGSTLVQPDLAATLQRLAKSGPADFYEGETARRLVNGIRAAGGIIGYRDLREYKPIWRAPLEIGFNGYAIYTMPPPSGGGMVLAESLNILSAYDLEKTGFQTPRSLHLLAEAERRAYIDRNKYVGDPASTRIPFRLLLSAERAALWRRSIDPDRATLTASLAEPASAMTEGSDTTHFTIVDEKGNVVSLTTTINENFGSGFVVPGAGFLLNNEMDDFTAATGQPNRAGLVQGVVNSIEPGKRMISSMTPAIIMRNDRPFMALGTRGGPTIPTTILQVFLNVTVWGLSLSDALAAPRYHQQALPEEMQYEMALAPKGMVDALNAMGHGVRGGGPIGDVHAILIDRGKIVAVADPRRGGAAGGY